MSAPAEADRRLLEPSLFTTVDGELRLLGSRCRDCATVTFPAQASCPRCAGQDVAPHALAAGGVLWAFTVQRFTPKTPYLGASGPASPYVVGYVDLGGEVLVESRIVVAPEDLAIGAALALTLEPLPGADGDPVWMFAFGSPTDPTPDQEAGR